MNTFRLREEKARFAREEAADLERKLAPVKQELSATLQRAEKMTKAFWSQPLPHLARLVNEQSFEADHSATYPQTQEPQGGARGREQFETFVAETLPRKGFQLSDAGAQRLLLFVVAQSLGDNHADMANPETWRIAFDQLYRLDCFDITSEVGWDASQVEQEPVVETPAPEPSVDDLERIDTSTREGTKIAHQILSRAVFDGEAKEVYLGWLRSLVNNFGYEMPEDVQREVIEWFMSNRRSWMDRKAYDDCRLNFCKNGRMPATCLTPDDILAQSIESEDTQSYIGRRNLKMELAASRLRN